MPELPEVQTVVDFLKDKLAGKTIQSVQSPNGYKGVFHNGSLTNYRAFLYKRQIQSILACPPKVVPSVKLVFVQTERNKEYDT